MYFFDKHPDFKTCTLFEDDCGQEATYETWYAHADELGALAREYECFHLSDVLGLNIFSVGAVLLLLSDRMVVCCAGTAFSVRLPETGAKIHIFRHSRSGRG